MDDTPQLMLAAIQKIIKHVGELSCESALYESEPWGFEASKNFLNKVIEISTNMDPLDLLRFLLSIEKELGRKRNSGVSYASRGIDIDILFLDDLVISSQELIVPHPRLHQRRFTLMPLSEQWPNLKHPTIGLTIKELLINCKDEGFVKLLDYSLEP